LATDTLASQSSKTVDVPHGERVYSFFATPILGAGYVNLYGQDITERKHSEEALRESEERYRQLFELESDAILLIDNETGQILEANAAATAMYAALVRSCCAKRIPTCLQSRQRPSV
jgi:PAS domain-containing protein